MRWMMKGYRRPAPMNRTIKYEMGLDHGAELCPFIQMNAELLDALPSLVYRNIWGALLG